MKIKLISIYLLGFVFLKNNISIAQSPGQLKEVLSSTTVHFANNLEFSKDGNYMVLVVGFNADVYRKKENGFQLVQTIKGGRWQAYNPGISNDGTYICFSNYEDTYVYKRNGDSYSLFQTIQHPGKSENKDLIMQFDENEKLMIVGGEGNIRYYELRENRFVEVKRVMNGGNVFQNAVLSANGKFMATIDGNGDLQCWQISSTDAVPGSVILKTNKYIGVLDITDDLLLASGTTDSLNLYTVSKDLKSATKIYQFPEGKFSEAKFNPDGNRIIIANRSSKLETYRISGNSLTLEYVNGLDRDNFTSIKMSEDGKWMAASSSGAKLIKIYEAPEKIVIAKKPVEKEKTAGKPAAKTTKPTIAAKEPVKTIILTGAAIPFKKPNGKYQIVDSVTGKPIYETEYQEVSKLKNGMLGIFQNEHYGIAKKTGQFIINPDTSKLRFIKEDADKAGNYYGWIYDSKRKNLLGDNVLFNKQYVQITSRAYMHINGLSLHEEGFYRTYFPNPDINKTLWGLLNKDGKEIIKPEYNYLKANPENRLIMVKRRTDARDLYGLYDYTGKKILAEEYHRIEDWDSPPNKKTMIVEKNELVGIVDKTGKIIVPFKYSSIKYEEHGANSYYSIGLNGKTGVMSLAFKEIIAPVYRFLFPEFEEGCDFFYASKDGIKEGWVDRTGKIILPLIHIDGLVCPDKEGLSRAKTTDSIYVFVNKKGQNVFNKKFRDAGHFRNGFAFVNEKNKYGMINATGAYVVQPVYDDIYDISNEMDKRQMYAAKKDGKWGFLDYAGKMVIPPQYDSENVERYAYSITENLIVVKLNSKWGFIDREGKTIIPMMYDAAYGFSDGAAEVMLNGENFKIDKKGTRIK